MTDQEAIRDFWQWGKPLLECNGMTSAHCSLHLLDSSNSTASASRHFGKLKPADHLSSGVQDQPGQHGKTLPLLKIRKISPLYDSAFLWTSPSMYQALSQIAVAQRANA
ncbi:hypothetical protein AAY473_027475 [Plecturocebus cupreus]